MLDKAISQIFHFQLFNLIRQFGFHQLRLFIYQSNVIHDKISDMHKQMTYMKLNALR